MYEIVKTLQRYNETINHVSYLQASHIYCYFVLMFYLVQLEVMVSP